MLKDLVYAPDGLERVQVVLARLSLAVGRLVGQQARLSQGTARVTFASDLETSQPWKWGGCHASVPQRTTGVCHPGRLCDSLGHRPGLAISTLTAAAFVAIYSPDLIALLS